jgi:hypothetical protein
LYRLQRISAILMLSQQDLHNATISITKCFVIILRQLLKIKERSDSQLCTKKQQKKAMNE